MLANNSIHTKSLFQGNSYGNLLTPNTEIRTSLTSTQSLLARKAAWLLTRNTKQSSSSTNSVSLGMASQGCYKNWSNHSCLVPADDWPVPGLDGCEVQQTRDSQLNFLLLQEVGHHARTIRSELLSCSLEPWPMTWYDNRISVRALKMKMGTIMDNNPSPDDPMNSTNPFSRPHNTRCPAIVVNLKSRWPLCPTTTFVSADDYCPLVEHLCWWMASTLLPGWYRWLWLQMVSCQTLKDVLILRFVLGSCAVMYPLRTAVSLLNWSSWCPFIRVRLDRECCSVLPVVWMTERLVLSRRYTSLPGR